MTVDGVLLAVTRSTAMRCIRKENRWADPSTCEVSNGLHSDTGVFTREQAKAICSQCHAQLSPTWSCNVLHDWACDDASWRVCENVELADPSLYWQSYSTSKTACGIYHQPDSAISLWARPANCTSKYGTARKDDTDGDCLDPIPDLGHSQCEGDCDKDSECESSSGLTPYKSGTYCNNVRGPWRSGMVKPSSTNQHGKSLFNDQAAQQCAGEADEWHYCSYPPGSLGPTNATAGLVADLSLLLTAGKLTDRSKRLIANAYDSRFAETSSTPEALKMAEQLMLAAPEFHTTNLMQPSDETRAAPEALSNKTDERAYKAIVVVFLAGGLDSFNLLMPHSGCKTNTDRLNFGCDADDYFCEYEDVRGVGVALKREEVQIISSLLSPVEQPCVNMSIHPNLPLMKQLYDEGDAVFVAGVGSLVEPLSKAQYEAKAKRFPPGLFAHNIQQRCAQNLHADYGSAKGILGRITAALESQDEPYKTAQYSLAGSLKIVEGGKAPQMLDKVEGAIRYQRYGQMVDTISNLTGVKAKSVYAETYSEKLKSSVISSHILGETMGNVSLSETFAAEELAQQLSQVAKVIKSRHVLGGQRDVFVVKMGGFDTHNIFTDTVWDKMPRIDDAIDKFAKEMKNEGVWENVVLPFISDFGRTITSNGAGTDHAWAGNMPIVGGGIKGARILGQFPAGINTEAEARTSRGRLIPTTPWESMWNPIAAWFGVEAAHMPSVLPNRGNFGSCACSGACDPNDALLFPPGQSITQAMCVAGGGVWTTSLFELDTLFGDAAVPGASAPSSSPAASCESTQSCTSPDECSGCCTVLFKGAKGAKCTAVPIWDFSSWTHPGPGYITRTNGFNGESLCGKVRHNWADHSGSHTNYDPESGSSLNGGATKVGEYTDTENCR